MPKPFEPPLMVTLKPSMRLRQFVLAVHGIAMAAGIANALPIGYKIILVAAIAVHFFYSVKRLNSALCTIRFTDASGWEIGEGDTFESIDILKSTVLTTFAIWLHVKRRPGAGLFANNKRSILITSDALDEDDYRRLIVKLKTSVIQ